VSYEDFVVSEETTRAIREALGIDGGIRRPRYKPVSFSGTFTEWAVGVEPTPPPKSECLCVGGPLDGRRVNLHEGWGIVHVDAQGVRHVYRRASLHMAMGTTNVASVLEYVGIEAKSEQQD
jgi:hypothetical protein